MADMGSSNACLSCGAPLGDGAHQGFCPKCLFGQAIGGTMGVSSPDEERIGATIGRYRLLEKVGEGGFGAVYVAEQLEPVKRRVALKIIKLGMDTRQVIARFEAERQALALMEHPNIAKILDAGVTGASDSQLSTLNSQLPQGRPYFVMELVRGVRITDYCDQNNLPTEQRLHLFMQVCHAIQHAHQKGIIHRDIKPSNILVTVLDGQPVPKVIDFGVAKATQGQLTDKTVYTELHQFIGTPAYMSPEQAALSAVDVDTRSDIYSLGVLLYELLTGHTPFDPKTLLTAGLDEMRRMIREQEPPRPSTRISTLEEAERNTVANHRQAEPAALGRLVRGDLDWIVMKCLEKERARRYETANALAQDIQHHLNQEPVAAAAPSTLYRAGKFIRRHKAGLATTIALVLLLAAGAVVSTWQAVRATRAERIQSRLRQQAEAEKTRADAHSQQAGKEKEVARFNLYVARISLAQQELENGQLGLALNLLEGQRPKEGEEDLRGFEWYYLWRRCNRGLVATLRGEEGIEALKFSPDGATLLSVSRNGVVRSWALSGGPEQELFRIRDTGMSCAEFSRDGKMLAWGSTNGTIDIWDISRRTVRTNIKAHSGLVRSLAFSPDSRRLACGEVARWVSGWVRVWDVESSEAPEHEWEHPKGSAAVAFSPDGALLAASDSGDIRVYDLATSQLRRSLIGHRWWFANLAFFPDSKTLVSGSADVKLWDLSTGQEKTAPKLKEAQKLALSPDGTRLAVGHTDGTVEVWDARSEQVRRYAHRKEVRALAFSPDGNRLASGSLDGAIKLWDPRSPVESPPAELKEQKVWVMAFSPNGKLLAWTTDGGPARVQDVSTGKILATLPGGLLVAFSPDSQTLAHAPGGPGVTLWDTATWQRRAVLQGHTRGVWCGAFSPDGKALASGDMDGMIYLWDLPKRERRAVLEGHPSKSVWSLAFSPDGACLVSAGGSESALYGEAVLWEAATGQKRAPLPGGASWAAFSPDGSTLATGLVGGSVALWDPKTGRRTAELSGHVKFWRAMAFSPDGKELATCNGEGSVTIWDMARGQERATLRSRHEIHMLAFSPDGRTLATGDQCGEVEFWRAADEREVMAQVQDFDHLLELARESSRQGALLQERGGQDAEAREAYFNAVALYESAAAHFPGRGEYKPDLIAACGQLFKLVADSSQLATQDCRRALALVDKVFALAEDCALPQRIGILCDGAKLLERAGRTEEALAIFTKAIERGSADTNACALILAETWLGRGDLLRRLNRLKEAAADRCQAFNIPQRDPQGGTNLADLSLFYNENLARFGDSNVKQNRQDGAPDNSSSGLPTGIQTLVGTPFDVRGLVRFPANRSMSVAGISIHRKFARLHILHGTGWTEANGTKIGGYVLHYADGRQSEMPILYGEDVRDWWQANDPKEATRAAIAWTGPKPDAPSVRLRLFKRTWDNPRPEVEVESIDFNSTMTLCAPFLIALTVE